MEKLAPERSKIAAEIRQNRNLERSRGYVSNRNMDAYLRNFYGLSSFMDYVRSLPSSRLVLDIGAGTTKGIFQLSHTIMGKDLSFMATGLTRSKRVKKLLGKNNHRITSVERLRGIADNSVAGILALNSIAYSVAPRTAVGRMDEILIPGGIIKATFANGVGYDHGFQRHSRFSEILDQLGYDTALQRRNCWTDVLVAIKPGAIANISARELLQNDGSRHVAPNNRLFRKYSKT